MFPKSFLLGSITSTCLAFAATTNSVAAAGTDILHFFDRASFSETNASSATGNVYARQNKQGHSDNESVSLAFDGLSADSAYTLQVAKVDDTNTTSVADFTADSRGRAKLDFRKLGNGKSLGKNKLPLPDTMDPVSELRTLVVIDANTNAVLTADLSSPERLQYLIKRNLSTNDVTATLRIQSNTQTTRLRLSARGLDATSDYLLVLNGGIVQTNSTDAHGRLELGTELIDPLDILDLRSVTVWDSVSNVVVTTTLP